MSRKPVVSRKNSGCYGKPAFTKSPAEVRVIKDRYEFIKSAMQNWWDSRDLNVARVRHSRDAQYAFRVLNTHRSLKPSQILDALRFVWPDVTGEDARDVLDLMEVNNNVRTERGVIVVTIYREDEAGAKDVPRDLEPKRAKVKSGTCPLCGRTVGYKNRHARKGSAHTPEQCSLFRISDVHSV